MLKGLRFIPTPVTNETFTILQDELRLQYIFNGKDNKPHSFHVKSNWEPPVQPSVALESNLERIKFRFAGVHITKPENNLPPAERKTLGDLKNNIEIDIRKAERETASVFMSIAEKKNEEQI